MKHASLVTSAMVVKTGELVVALIWKRFQSQRKRAGQLRPSASMQDAHGFSLPLECDYQGPLQGSIWRTE